jgi:hypothetical protein
LLGAVGLFRFGETAGRVLESAHAQSADRKDTQVVEGVTAPWARVSRSHADQRPELLDSHRKRALSCARAGAVPKPRRSIRLGLGSAGEGGQRAFRSLRADRPREPEGLNAANWFVRRPLRIRTMAGADEAAARAATSATSAEATCTHAPRLATSQGEDCRFCAGTRAGSL